MNGPVTAVVDCGSKVFVFGRDWHVVLGRAVPPPPRPPESRPK